MTDPSLLRACQDAPWDMVPRLVYADWLEEHGHRGVAKRLRNEYNGKVLLSMLPPLAEQRGPYPAPYDPAILGTVWSSASYGASTFSDLVHWVMFVRGMMHWYATPWIKEYLNIHKGVGGGYWARWSPVVVTPQFVTPTVLIDMTFDRPPPIRNFVARYAPTIPASYAD